MAPPLSSVMPPPSPTIGLVIGECHCCFTQDYAMSIYLRQHWTDRRLAFEHLSNETVLMLDARMLTRLWVPDLYFSNEKDSHFHDVMVPNTFIRLHSDGSIVYSARLVAEPRTVAVVTREGTSWLVGDPLVTP